MHIINNSIPSLLPHINPFSTQILKLASGKKTSKAQLGKKGRTVQSLFSESLRVEYFSRFFFGGLLRKIPRFLPQKISPNGNDEHFLFGKLV